MTTQWIAESKGTRHKVWAENKDCDTLIADRVFDAEKARLIAAAPDLLEALTGLLANAPAPKGIRQDFSYTLYLEAARKAVAKATNS